jgi:hypothetical protein
MQEAVHLPYPEQVHHVIALLHGQFCLSAASGPTVGMTAQQRQSAERGQFVGLQVVGCVTEVVPMKNMGGCALMEEYPFHVVPNQLEVVVLGGGMLKKGQMSAGTAVDVVRVVKVQVVFEGL